MKDPTLGTLHMRAKDANHTLQCVQFACNSDRAVVVASVAGPQTAVKSFAAALNENVKLVITCSDFEMVRPDGESVAVRKTWEFTRVSGGQGRYKCHMHRLGYNQVHCLAVVKDETFMPCVTEESVWHKLNSPLFTTPLLREWTPWLMQQMLDAKSLVKLPSFQCSPGLLNISEAALDKLVTLGVGTGVLNILRKEGA